jgi:hypothetical protein
MTARHALAALSLSVTAPAAGQAPEAAPQIDVPADTQITPATGWPLRVRTAGPTRVTVLLAPVAPDAAPLHLETQVVRDARTFWPLHGANDASLEPGIYRLLVVTQDSASGHRATRVRVLAIERLATDTQAHPPVLDRRTFLPESAYVVSRRPGFLLIAGIGVAALATAWTFEEDRGLSPITLAVPGAMAVGGLVGFLKGRHVPHPAPANAAHNQRLVDDDLAARRAIAGANARALAAATWRIRVLDQP